MFNRRNFLAASTLAVSPLILKSETGAATQTPEMPWEYMPPADQLTYSINGEIISSNNTVSQTIKILPGAKSVHIKLTYDFHEIVSTAFVAVQVINTGGGINPSNVVAPIGYQYWRPGDDKDLWISLEITKPSSRIGDNFKVYFIGNGVRGNGSCIIEVAEGAENRLPNPLPFHRAPKKLNLSSPATVELDLGSMQWSDSGFVGNSSSGTPCWRSRLSHGYTQPGNGENGLYTNTDAFPSAAITPHSLESDEQGREFVRLHSAKFENPVSFEGNTYPFQATALQAAGLKEWAHKRGLFRGQFSTPSQRGAWSAFWLVGVRNGKTIWPPEIDCFESFNGAYGAPYTKASTSSAQHVGRHGSGKRSNQFLINMDLSKAGFSKDIDLNNEIHDYACLIDDIWITHFIDGIETVTYRNMTDPGDGNTDWNFFPIVNVAVRTDPSTVFTNGRECDLRWYGLQYFQPASVKLS
jgi:hypothetical protein